MPIQGRPIQSKQIQPIINIGMLQFWWVKPFKKQFLRDFILIVLKIWNFLRDRKSKNIPFFVGVKGVIATMEFILY